MDVRLQDVFSISRLTPARRLQVYRRMRATAERLGFTELVAHIDLAIAHDQDTRTLDEQWRAAGGRSSYQSDVPDIDLQVDQCLGGIRDVIAGQMRSLPEGDTVQQMAIELMDALFPAGLRTLINLPYVEQAAAVDIMVNRLRSDLASHVTALGLGRQVAHLTELSRQYLEALDRGRTGLAFADVRAARRRGQTLLLEIVALAVCTYYDSLDPAHVAVRNELLTPVLEQIAQARAYMRSRRARGTGGDADPDLDDTVDEDPSPQTSLRN